MQIETKAVNFQSDGLTLRGSLVYPLPKNGYYGVLFVHGGGLYYPVDFYAAWQEYLGARGYSSFSFFGRGVAPSEGNFSDSSLNNRLKDAQAALEFFKNSGLVDQKVIAVYASSMGGHVAVRLLEKHKEIKALILQSAAAYGKALESLSLGTEFTEAVRKPESWRDSPVFKILANYRYPVKVVYGKADSVIPSEVQQKYCQSARKTTREILLGGGHALLRPKTAAEKRALEKLYLGTVDFLNKNLG